MATWSTQEATREYQMAANGELTVVERLATLLETGQFADVTIRVGEGDDTATFKAHSLLLATASQPLSKLMYANGINGPSGEVKVIRITDIDPEAFQHVLKYIYTDDLKIDNVSEAFCLLKISKNWGLAKLGGKTIQYLDSFLDDYEPTTADRKNELCDLVVMIEDQDGDLKTKCWKVLLQNVNEVVPCQGFLNMSFDLVSRILKHKDFSYKNQLVLFESIRDWGMNQVLQRNLHVDQLQEVVGGLMQYVDFKSIQDGDFMDTILPSECLGKGDLIAFFMTRGLEIPRDLAYNNNLQDSSVTKDGSQYEKTSRYKRGYKLPDKDVYREHELRFRVDKKLKLLGVGFGFLFSNTDMGITVHCKGPWETRQWQDIIQTYCRVSYEKMKTADVRLMFSEPVVIEPFQSYKILVRVGRMSTGSTDVDLWGGSQGVPTVQAKDAEFSFLKAAIDPKKEVSESDIENNPGMITDLFYQLCDSEGTNGTPPTSPLSHKALSSIESATQPASPLSPKPYLDSSNLFKPKVTERKEMNGGISRSSTKYAATSKEEDSKVGTTSASSYSYRRHPSSVIYNNEELPSSPTTPTPAQQKEKVEEYLPNYLKNKTTSRTLDTLPPFLRARQPSTERTRPSWEIPSRIREVSLTRFGPREYENYVPKPKTKDTPDLSERFPISKYGVGISKIKSVYESGANKDSPTSRYGSNASATSKATTYGSTTSNAPTESRYSSSTSSNPRISSRYANSSSDSSLASKYGSSGTGYSYTPSASRFGSSASNLRLGRDHTASPSRSLYNSNSTVPTATSRYGQSNSTTTTRDSGLNTSSPLPTRKYGSSASTAGKSRYDFSSNSTSAASPVGSSRYTSNSSGTSGITNSLGTSRYGVSPKSTSSAINTSSRYGGSSPSTSGITSSLGSSRYGSNLSNSSGVSRVYGTSRYGASSPTIGSSYSSPSSSYSSPSSRFSSSTYNYKR